MTSGGGLQAKIAWGILETGGKAFAGEYRVIESGLVISGDPALFAVDSKSQRYLLCPIGSIADPEEDLRSAGVQLQSRRLSDGGVEHRFAALVCLKPRLTEVFAALVDEVLDRLAANPERADSVCRQVLDEWRELLERELSKGLSVEARVGLFGELWTLRELILLDRAALPTWVGPNGARHDFMAADLALETKTSTSRRGRFAEIHGVEQLEAFPGTQLYLSFIRVERVPAGGHSIPELVEEIVVHGANRSEFLKRLSLLGYDDRDIGGHAVDRFRVTEERYYAVDDEFPRITSVSFVERRVPSGVTRLTYEIDLSAEPPQPLDSTQIRAIHSRLARGRKSE